MGPLPAIAVPGKDYAGAVRRVVSLAQKELFVSCFIFSLRSYLGKQILEDFSAAISRGVVLSVALNQRLAGGVTLKHTKKFGGALENIGALVKRWPTKQVCHSKLFIADRRYILIGSHNISDRSITTNIETSIFLDDEKIAEAFLDYFNSYDIVRDHRYDKTNHLAQVQSLKARFGLDKPIR